MIMCKTSNCVVTPEYIATAISRVNEFLPAPVAIRELSVETREKIPFGLGGAYDFYEGEILGIPILFAGVGENEDDMTPAVISKQRDALQDLTGLTVVFIFSKLTSYVFSRYTKKSVNLIVGNRHAFLPSLLLVVGKDITKPVGKDEKMPAFAQLLILYHLQKEDVNGQTMRQLAEKLNISYPTVNRGVRWMKEHGLICLNGDKEKTIEFIHQGKRLWDETLPLMENPVEFTVYTTELRLGEKGLVSGEIALAEYSLLNGGPCRIAVSKDVYKEIKKMNIYWDQFGEVGIEVWRYDPKQLSDTSTIDKLSLYLLLRNNEDERVQIELENMINEIEW